MAEKRCLKEDVLSTVSRTIDFAMYNAAQNMELTIKVDTGNIPHYEAYIDGVCIPPKNGDLRAEKR